MDGRTIDDEVVSSRAISDRPGARVDLACDTHPAWLDCGLGRPDCVGYMVTVDPPDYSSDVVTFRFRDRRRLSYPRLTADEREQ